MVEKSEYKSLKEWKKSNPKDYNRANHKGWIIKLCNNFDWEPPKKSKPSGYWNKERVLEEARLYTTRRDWKKFSKSSYELARQTDWFDECTSHMVELVKPPGYWNNKERCIKEAKKYKRIVDWAKNGGGGAIRYTKKNGWFDECIAHMEVRKTKPKGYWTKERVLEVALTCGTKQEWANTCLGSYTFARRNGWIEECCKDMNSQINNTYWTKEKCIEEANKYQSQYQWRVNSQISFVISGRKYGWFDECIAHMIGENKPSRYWNKEKCIIDAKKYKSRNEWRKNGAGSYLFAFRQNIFDECTSHMVELVKPPGYWNNKERCLEEAKKYKTRTDWAKGSGGSYYKANENNWRDECCEHMDKIKTSNGYWNNKELCLEEAKKYKTRTDWAKGSYSSIRYARRNSWMEECSKHMK